MEPRDLWALMLLGLLGTGHCLGMCGPLVVAFPGRTGRLGGHLAYHAGRLLTYTLLGGAVAGLGRVFQQMGTAAGADPLTWVARSQVALSAMAALFLLGFGLGRLGLLREPVWLNVAAPSRLPGAGPLLRSAFDSSAIWPMWPVGMLMGLLPCGLSYAALARALAAGRVSDGALMLLCFGVGTLPGMLLLGTGIGRLLQPWRRQAELLAGMLMIGMAAGLIADLIGAWG